MPELSRRNRWDLGVVLATHLGMVKAYSKHFTHVNMAAWLLNFDFNPEKRTPHHCLPAR